MYDRVIRGGKLVIPGVGELTGDIGIAGGRIAALGAVDAQSATDVIDVDGHQVLPGLVDPHVHFGNQLSFQEETLTETRAAVLGGTTTVGVMLLNFGGPYDEYMDMVRESVA